MVEIGRVGIVGGAGWLGLAIARALVVSDTVAMDRLICSWRSKMPDDALGCAWTQDNAELVQASDIVILSVRPADWPALRIDARGKLVISVMAGVTANDIRAATGSDRIARAVPNAAAAIRCSYTPYVVRSSDPCDTAIVAALLASCGEVGEVATEELLDYLTTMSGSGAAFPALLADAMITAAVAHGVPHDIARRAAEMVIIGAGRLQEHDGMAPAKTVGTFVDYGGTTAAAILTMQDAGFDRAVAAGLQAAFQKAQAIAAG